MSKKYLTTLAAFVVLTILIMPGRVSADEGDFGPKGRGLGMSDECRQSMYEHQDEMRSFNYDQMSEFLGMTSNDFEAARGDKSFSELAFDKGKSWDEVKNFQETLRESRQEMVKEKGWAEGCEFPSAEDRAERRGQIKQNIGERMSQMRGQGANFGQGQPANNNQGWWNTIRGWFNK